MKSIICKLHLINGGNITVSKHCGGEDNNLAGNAAASSLDKAD